MPGGYFSDNLTLLGLIVGYLLAHILSAWLAPPIAYSLGFFFGTLTLAPFARKHDIRFRRLFGFAFAAAGIGLIWMLILQALNLVWNR